MEDAIANMPEALQVLSCLLPQQQEVIGRAEPAVPEQFNDAAALAAARIARLCYGAEDPKSGGVAHGARVFTHPQCHHVPEIVDGLAAVDAEALLKDFFAAKREG